MFMVNERVNVFKELATTEHLFPSNKISNSFKKSILNSDFVFLRNWSISEEFIYRLSLENKLLKMDRWWKILWLSEESKMTCHNFYQFRVVTRVGVTFLNYIDTAFSRATVLCGRLCLSCMKRHNCSPVPRSIFDVLCGCVLAGILVKK